MFASDLSQKKIKLSLDQFQQVNFFVKIQAASSVLRSSKIGFLELVKKY